MSLRGSGTLPCRRRLGPILILLALASRTREEEQELTFSKQLRYGRVIDTGHLGAALSVNAPVTQYNRVFDAVRKAEKKVVEELHRLVDSELSQTSSTYNKTIESTTRRYHRYFVQLKAKLSSIHDDLTYLCLLVTCQQDLAPLPDLLDTPFKVKKKEKARKKRQFGIPIALVALGLSIYTLVEVETIKKDVFRIQRTQEQLSALIEAEKIAIYKDEQMIQTVTERINDIEQWTSATLVATHAQQIMLLLTTVTENLKDYAHSLLDVLLYKKINPRFFELKAMNVALEDLRNRAQQQEMNPVYHSLNELLTADVSFIVENGTLHLLLHVPLTDTDQYTLYRLLSSPIRLPDGRTVRVQAENRYLAVNKDMTVFQELGEEDLRKCKTVGGLYACKAGVVAKNAHSSCVAGLFTKTIVSVKEYCVFKTTNETRETVLQVQENQVLVTAPTISAVEVFVRCSNGSSTSQVVKTVVKVHVPPRCVLSTPNFSFESSKQAAISSEFLTRPIAGFEDISWDNWDTLPNKPLKFRLSELESPYPAHLETHVHVGNGIAGMVLALFIVAFVCFIVIRVGRADCRKKRKRRINSSRMNILQEEETPL